MRTYTLNSSRAADSSDDGDSSSQSAQNSDQVDFVIYTITGDSTVQVVEFQEGELNTTDKSVLSVHSLLASNPEAQEALCPFPAYLQSLLRSDPFQSRLSQGIHIIEACLPWISDQDEKKPQLAHLLGDYYNNRAQYRADPSDLDKAVRFNTQATLLTPAGHNEKPRRINTLGGSYLMRFQRLGDLSELERAIEYHTQACQMISDEHPKMPNWLLGLAAAVMTRFLRLGDMDDLNCAIAHYDKTVLLTPQGDPEMSRRLSNLGLSLQIRSRHLHSQDDLDRAIHCHTQAIQIAPSESRYKPGWLCELGSSLSDRFERLRNIEDLNEAISCQRQAISLAPDDHAPKPGWLTNLGQSLHSRYMRLGDVADLNDAVYYQNQAVVLSPDDHPSKNVLLSELGRSQMSRFTQLGNLVDLDNSIIHQRQAVLLTPEGHAERARFLNHLGASHLVRFDRLEDTADIENAISCHERAVLLTPDGHPYKPRHLSALGISYETRFQQQDNVADLENAVSCHIRAVSLATDDYIDKASWLGRLGCSLLSRYKRLADKSDLDRAVSYLKQADSLIPDGHPHKAGELYNLSHSWMSRFELSGAQEDLHEAIAHLSKALLLAPNDFPFRANILVRLGLAYRKQFEHFQDDSSLSQSINCFQRAAQESTGSPSDRLRAAHHWAQASFHSPDISPLDGYKQALELVPQIVWLGSKINHRYRHTLTVSDIIAEAAVTAIELQEYELALEWLEEGNSIVWKQILQLRTPLDDLRRMDSGLADELEKTAKELDRASVAIGEYPALDPLSSENAAQSHRRLAERYERLLEQARNIPGLLNFMHPKKASELLSAARYGPVVLLSVHRSRCDALVLLPESNTITHVPLPRLSYESSIGARNQLAKFLNESHVKRGGFKIGASASPDVMDMLWQSVVKPVLEHLGYMTPSPTSELPHITWCTSGPLAFLPLHAAGCYKEPHERVFDYAISSYTPTLSALLAPIPGPETFHGILAVGQANTPGYPQLPATEAEVSQVERQARTLPVQRLTKDNATVAAVLSAMEDYSWIHMACHASQNRADPTRSAFHLHDGALELASIMQKPLKEKGLAFLSACETATGDDNLPSESVHLAAGMLMAGYRSVIATMWSIQDQDAPLIAEKVYAQLLDGGVADTRKTAKALHDAVEFLRVEVGEKNFARWVPYIHIGL